MNIIEEVIGRNHGAMTINIDNISAIKLAKNMIAHERRKHMKVRFHYLIEHVANVKMSMEHCTSDNHIADIMTNVMRVELFKRLRTIMNVNSLDTMN